MECVRQHRRAGRRGVGRRKGAVKVHKIVVRGGHRLGDQPRHDQGADGRRHVYGLTAALKGEITIQNGRVVQRHFNDYQMMRHQRDAARSRCYIVPSAEAPGGIGEPSTALAAGSLVNAISAATGKRIYRLPIKPEMLAPKATA